MKQTASETVTLIAKITAKKGMERLVQTELRALVGPTRSEPGCLQYDLHSACDGSGTFLFVERWRSQADIELHFQKPYLVALKAKEAEILACPVEISLWQEDAIK